MGSTSNTACGIPQFNGGPDFQHWSFRVKMYLDSVGVLKNLTENAPAVEADKVKFDEADRKAKALIVSFLANECLEVIREKSTAKGMWEALEATFATKSIGSQHLIRKQLNRLKLKEGDPMRPHLMIFDDLIRQMKTAGAKVEDADLVVLLFQTLPDSYDPLVTALENVPEKDLKIEIVKQRLLAEDMKRQERTEECGEVSGAAFSGDKTKPRFQFKGKCHKCGKRGHLQRDCWMETDGEANAGDTHRKAVSFVASWGNGKRKLGKLVFKLDSGASDHMVNDSGVFAVTRKLGQMIEINVAKDGQSLVAKAAGEIHGNSNKQYPLHMKEVLFVPELRDNLMSVKKLAVAGVQVNFVGKIAVLKKGGATIATAYLKSGLYELEVNLDVRTGNGCADGMDLSKITRDVKCEKACSLLAVRSPHEQEGEPVDKERPMQKEEATHGTKDDRSIDPETANTGALPSQLEQHESVVKGQPMLRRSERERRLPGKYLYFFPDNRATSVGSYVTDDPHSCGVIDRDDQDYRQKAIREDLSFSKRYRVSKMQCFVQDDKPLQSKQVFRVKKNEYDEVFRCNDRWTPLLNSGLKEGTRMEALDGVEADPYQIELTVVVKLTNDGKTDHSPGMEHPYFTGHVKERDLKKSYDVIPD